VRERGPLYEIVARYLKAVGDPRQVVSHPGAPYWGGRVEERSPVPLAKACLGRIASANEYRGSMNSILCSLLIAILPFGSVLAAKPLLKTRREIAELAGRETQSDKEKCGGQPLRAVRRFQSLPSDF
jgi:hypothetical protein